MQTGPSSEEFKHLLNDLYARLDERDRWLDQALRFLTYGNGGGIALIIALIARAHEGEIPQRLLIPLVIFLFGLILVGILIHQAACFARIGRNRIRTLCEQYLKQAVSYEKAFLELGTLPSKWEQVWRLGIASFVCLLAGSLAAGALLSYPKLLCDVSDWFCAT
jgi:hypothetical protein